MSLPRTLVALETSGAIGSVAVSVGGDRVARAFLLEAREHAAGLVPALARALARAGVERRDLEGVVVGAGPGSFTGVRVAAATGKGLAHALGIPLWAVSSLEAAAVGDLAVPAGAGPWSDHEGPGPAGPRTVLFDARGRRIFMGTYDGRGPHLRTERPPEFTTLDALLEDSGLARALLCGEAALRHRAELEDAGRSVLAAPAGLPTADGLLQRLQDHERPPLEDPFGWEPDYLRATSAEREAARPESTPR
jgi:tRNA threonylcarbamoyladenosine biosynthesis protein TsaB